MILYEHHNSHKKDHICFGTVSDLRFPAHMHHSFEYVTILNGRIKMTVGGQKFTLSRHDGMFIVPGQIHSYEPFEGSSSTIAMVQFSIDYLPEFSSAPYCDELRSPLVPSYRGAPTVSDISAVSNDRFLAKAKIYELASVYLRGDSFDGTAASQDRFAARVLHYLNGHYTEPITMRSAASALGYNYRYFSGMINRCFGTSFVKLIGEYRISYACNLLMTTDLHITEICYKCGFDTIRSFNRTFKLFCGITPGEYRKNCIIDNSDFPFGSDACYTSSLG